MGLIVPSPFTHFLSQFGFAFLMFLAGMEINFVQVERLGRKGLAINLMAALLVFLLAFGAVRAAGMPDFFVLVLASMSLGLVLVALRDTGHGPTKLGQSILVLGTLGEFLTILLLTVTDLDGEPSVDLRKSWAKKQALHWPHRPNWAMWRDARNCGELVVE